MTPNRLPNRNPDDRATLPCSGTEKALAAVALLAVLVLRVVYVFRLKVDSDEPQHIHVAWQWSQGLVAYRDFFDNHTPLFHLLMAPFVGWLGERADILDLARLFVVPCFVIALGAVRSLGRKLFSERVALWAPVFAGAFPKYLFPCVEFRTDNLWASIWLVTLAVLINGRPSVKRSFTAGLLAGLGFATSMKTGLLLGTLAGAATATFLFAHEIRANMKLSTLAANLASGAAGLAVAPGLLVWFFSSAGALAQLRDCVFLHNLLPAGIDVERRPPSWMSLAFAFAILILVAWRLFRAWSGNSTAFRRTLVFLHMGFAMAILKLAWPVSTRQNDLPVYPLMILFLTALLVTLLEHTARRFPRFSFAPALAMVAVLMIGWCMGSRSITTDLTLPADHLIADALKLTAPGEYVMTYKGEAVFRPRPYYYVMEPFTRARLNNGLLPDEIPQRLIDTRTCVAMTLTHRYPVGTRHFLEENYVPVGQLRVAGQELPGANTEGNIRFTIRIPADYTLLRNEGGIAGIELDGKPFPGSGFIGAGEHVLRIPGAPAGAVLLWSRAVQRGFKPKPHGYEPEKVGTEF